jgi:hypothetical protein
MDSSTRLHGIQKKLQPKLKKPFISTGCKMISYPLTAPPLLSITHPVWGNGLERLNIEKGFGLRDMARLLAGGRPPVAAKRKKLISTIRIVIKNLKLF